MTKFSIPDMTCGHCKATVEAAIAKLDAEAGVKIDLAHNTAAIISATAGDQPIINALKEAGYAASILNS